MILDEILKGKGALYRPSQKYRIAEVISFNNESQAIKTKHRRD